MLALQLIAPGSVALVEADDPMPGDGDALVAPRYVGLCGTDLELVTGSMPYFAEGTATYPIQPGHEVTGVVVSSPDGRIAAGTPVLIDPVAGCGRCTACASGFQTRCSDRRELGLRNGMPGGASELIAVPAQNLHPIPDGVSARDAVLVEPGVTVLNAVNRLGNIAERRALVVGAGTLGLVAAQLLVNRGASTDVVARRAARATLVQQLGAQPVREVQGSTYDAVVEAAGTADAVRLALTAVAPGGKVALTGVFPGPVEQFDVNQVVLKDVTVLGVLNGPGLYDAMLEELAAGSVNAALLIDDEFELAEAKAAFAALGTRNRVAPKIILRISQ